MSNWPRNRTNYKRFAKLLRCAGKTMWILASLLDFGVCLFVAWVRTGLDVVTLLFFAPQLVVFAPLFEIAHFGNWRPLITVAALGIAGCLTAKFCNWLATGLDQESWSGN